MLGVAVGSYLELDGLLHGTQVDRDVGGIGHQPPVWAKECAGEVQPLLDVGGDGRALQDPAHLLCGAAPGHGRASAERPCPSPTLPARHHQPPGPTCDAHEAVGEDGELDGVEVGANRAWGPRADGDGDVAEAGEAGSAAWLHHDGAGGGGQEHQEMEECRASQGPHQLSRSHLFAGVQPSPQEPNQSLWSSPAPQGPVSSSGSPIAPWGPTTPLGPCCLTGMPTSSLESHQHPGVLLAPQGPTISLGSPTAPWGLTSSLESPTATWLPCHSPEVLLSP